MLGPRKLAAFLLCARRATALAALSWGIGACATAPHVSVTTDRRIAEARAEGITLEDPLAIDDVMRDAVDRAVSRSAPPADRLRHLASYLMGSGFVNFQYMPSRSLTAQRAFRERRGDCIAYTNMFLALARYLGIDAYFVHVREVQNFYEQRGTFFVSSHVAVGYGQGPEAEVIDFAKAISDWKLALYRSISDDAALALYSNNVAVTHMQAGRPAEAERLLRFWIARAPEMAELYNNLGVLLNRSARYGEALAILEQGIRRFPTYEPLYTNGLRAAHGAGRLDRERALAEQGEVIEHSDPFLIFARAMNVYRDARFKVAAVEFARARRAKPDSAVIVAWLARAYLRAGQRDEGLSAFEDLKRLAPGDPAIHELREQFPDLEPPPPAL
jgi:tetratricopeptide (TPR) repeat protein